MQSILSYRFNTYEEAKFFYENYPDVLKLKDVGIVHKTIVLGNTKTIVKNPMYDRAKFEVQILGNHIRVKRLDGKCEFCGGDDSNMIQVQKAGNSFTLDCCHDCDKKGAWSK